MLVEELKKYGKGSKGLQLHDGTRHKIFISRIYADTPARVQLAYWTYYNARHGCGFCWIEG